MWPKRYWFPTFSYWPDDYWPDYPTVFVPPPDLEDWFPDGYFADYWAKGFWPLVQAGVIYPVGISSAEMFGTPLVKEPSVGPETEERTKGFEHVSWIQY